MRMASPTIFLKLDFYQKWRGPYSYHYPKKQDAFIRQTPPSSRWDILSGTNVTNALKVAQWWDTKKEGGDLLLPLDEMGIGIYFGYVKIDNSNTHYHCFTRIPVEQVSLPVLVVIQFHRSAHCRLDSAGVKKRKKRLGTWSRWCFLWGGPS